MAEISFDDLPDTPGAEPVAAASSPGAASISFDDIGFDDIPAASSGSMSDYPVEFGKGFVEGAKNLPASALKGIGAAQTVRARETAMLSDAIERAQQGVDPASAIEQVQANPPTLGRIADQPLYQAGHAIEQFGKETLAPRPGFEPGKSWTRDIGSGFGSMTSGVGMSLIPGVGTPLAGTIFLGAGMGEAVDRAIEAGATEEQALQAAQLGAVAGATDIVDALLPALGSTGKALGFIKRVGLRTVYGALAEGGQEGLQQTIQNAIAKGVYKPNQDMLEDVPRSMAIGAIVGGVTSGGISAAQGKGQQEARARTGAPTATDAVEQPRAQQAMDELDAILSGPDDWTAPAPAAAAPEPVPASPTTQADPLQDLDDILAETRPAPVSPEEAMLREQDAMSTFAPSQVVEKIDTAAAEADRPTSPSPSEEDGVPGEPAKIAFLPPEALNIDADRFQFKGGADAKGVTGALKGVAHWDDRLANPILAWQDNAGKLWVANGHQRTDLAKRAREAGQEDIQIPTRILREADGFTPDFMRALGAYQNIAEGTGTAVDAAKVLRANQRDLGLPELPPRSALVQDAKALAALGDDAFGMVANGIVPETYAAQVGRILKDPAEQVAAMDALAKSSPANVDQARIMVEDIRESGFLKGAQTGLFGEEEFARSLVAERARILDTAIKNLRRLGSTFKTAVEQEGALTEAGNKFEREANVKAKTENERLAEILRTDGTRKGPISDALSDAARDLADGKRIGTVVPLFLGKVRSLARGKPAGIQHGAAADGAGPEGGKRQASAAPRGLRQQRAVTEPVTLDGGEAGAQFVLPGAEKAPSSEQAQRAADASLKPAVPQKPADEGLFGDTSRQTDLVDLARQREEKGGTTQPDRDAESQPEPGPIEDFGEKILGARKDTFAGFRESLDKDMDVDAEPLSVSFPQPNYEKLAEGGVDRRALALIAIMRDMIPVKPRKSWKLKEWSGNVSTLRNFSRKLLDGEIDPAKVEEAARGNYALRDLPLTARAIEDVSPEDLTKAAAYRVSSGSYSMLHGERFSPSKRFWFLEGPERRAMRNPLSNDPARSHTYRDSPDEAVTLAKEIIAHDLARKDEQQGEPESKYTHIGLYRDRRTSEYFLGFKARSTVIRLKAGFTDPKAAREYLAENRDRLQQTIDEMRAGPNMRGAENRPRTGSSLREGDVTPSSFSETFGFRGVQFGNYVEGSRRQADLNRAYDALMDLADVLGVPPRALSLDGSLGLAFGARGKGGRNAAAAHYEPGQVVINLTKTSGPGSLAHEWMHALDNYFAKRDSATGYMSERKRGAGPVRSEVYEAWKNIEKSIASGSFAERSMKFDETRSKPYWNTTIEKAARAFERYAVDRLAEKGSHNDYLANIDLQGGAYPTEKEMQGLGIRAAFDQLFATLEVEAAPSYALFDARRDLTPRAQEKRPQLEKQLTAVVRGIAGPHVRVAFQDKIPLPDSSLKAWGSYTKGVYTAAGTYIPAERLIKIALADPKYRHVASTTLHESFHAVENLLLNDREMAVLKKAEPQLRNIAQGFAELSTEQAAELVPFEVRAIAFEAFADARANKQPVTSFPAATRAIFDRMRIFFERIRNALSGLGFKSAEDVFTDVFRGKMAGRPPSSRPFSDAFDIKGGAALDPVALSRFIRGEITADELAPGQPKWAKVQAYLEKNFTAAERQNMGSVLDRVMAGSSASLETLTPRERAVVEKLLQASGGRPPNVPPPPSAPSGSGDGAQRRILDRIVPSDTAKKRLPTLNQVYTLAKDDLNPLRVLRNELGGKNVPIEQDPYRLARLSRGAFGKAEQMLETGTYRFGDLADSGKGLKQVLAPVQNDLDGFRAYMAARRSLELAGRDIKTGIAISDAAHVVRAGAAKYAKPFTELVAFQRRVLDYLRDAGLVSPEAYAAMLEANKDYVPFFRLMDDDGKSGGGSNSRALRVKDPIKGIKGSSREIIDPIESIIKNTYLYIALAEKNRALTALDELAQQSPKGEQFVTKPKDRTPEPKEDGSAPESLSIFRPEAFRPSKDTIAFYRAGKREVREVAPDVAEAVNAMDRETFGILLRVLAAPARMLRAGATLSPEFIARNPIRDQFSAMIFSEHGYIPVYDFVKGLGGVLRNDAAYQAWLKSGGANSAMVSIDRNYIEQNVMQLSNDRTFGGRVLNVVKSPVEFLRMVSELAENSTRLGEFKRAIGQGKSPMEAAFSSREVTLDFARAGAQMRGINALIPFFNAQIEGTDREIRGFIKRPFATSLKVAAGITVPSILLWMANHDDPRYPEIPQWQKDLFWLVFTDKWEPINEEDAKQVPSAYKRLKANQWEQNNGSVWRIPKPFALGLLFGSVPERALDAYYGDHPKAFNHLGKSVMEAFLPNMVPTFALPFAEQWANRSLFTERPIVPKYLEDVLPEYQYAPYTSETAKLLGKALGAMGVDKSAAGSPLVIDNYIRAWTGGLGQYVVAASDKALTATGIVPSKVNPTMTPADMPIIRAFAVRHPSGGAQSIQDFYETYEERRKALGTVRYLTKLGEPDSAGAVSEERNLETAERVHKALGQQMKFARDVAFNRTMTPADKRRLIDTTYLQAIDLAKTGNDIFRATAQAKKDMKGQARRLENAP